MDIKILDGVSTEKPVTSLPTPPSILGGPSVELQSVAKLFDLKPSEIPTNKEKLQTLVDFAKSQMEGKSNVDLLWAIRSLMYKVGTPPLGEKILPYITRYAYLKLEQNRLSKEVEHYEHGNK